MAKLIIIAGCNGAGKSVFAPSFLPQNLTSFDYDKVFLNHYLSLSDSELRETIAKNTTTKEFELAIESALNNNTDFCYETNFDNYPLYWAQKFKQKGFTINLIFFCLENIEIAKHRVLVRSEFKGHFVPDKVIDLKWKAGYKNINKHYTFFDNILIVDNSIQNKTYSNILQIENGIIELMTENLPSYFKRRFPDIHAQIKF